MITFLSWMWKPVIPVRLSVEMIVLLQLITQSVRKKTWHQTSYLVSSQVCIIIKRFFFFFSLTCLFFVSLLKNIFMNLPRSLLLFFPANCVFTGYCGFIAQQWVLRKQAEEQQWVRALQPGSDSQCELRLSRVSCSGFWNNHAQFDEFSSFTV